MEYLMKQKLNLMENKTTEISKNKSFIFACISTLCFTETLEMDYLSCPKETDGICNLRDIFHHPEDIIVSGACLLFCCNHIRTTFD